MGVSDDAQKLSVSWLSTRTAIEVPEKQKDERPIESTDKVPTKKPLKIKLVIKESSITQKYKN